MPRTIQGDIPKDIVSCIAVTGLIFAVSVYMPIIGFFCALFIPLPTLFYRSKLGRTTGAIIPIIIIITMVAVLGGISIDTFFFVELLLLGFVLSELIELDLSIEKTMLYACGSVILVGIKARIIEQFGTQIVFTKAIKEYEYFVSRVVQNHTELPKHEQIRWANVLNSRAEDLFGKA